VHVQIVNFNLKDISEEDYRRHCEAIASAFANLPGLVSKIWLADPDTNTYGGVYVWQDLQAMEGYAETDLYKGMLANPHFDDITVRDFAVLENPTRVTRGTAEVAA
jgi:quinol monooxygenase YgiN